MNKKRNTMIRRGSIMRCISPLLIYYSAEILATLAVIMAFAQSKGITAAAFSSVDEMYITLMKSLTDNYQTVVDFSMILAYLILIPVFFKMYKRDRAINYALGYETKQIKVPKEHFLILVLMGLSFCLAGSAMMSMTTIPTQSAAYQQSTALLFGSGIAVELLLTGLLAPLAEELLFRGLLYLRLRERNPIVGAMLVSAVVFGMMHGNLVQGIYGSLCGLLLTFVYERYDALRACILVHVSANVTAILAKETDIFDFLFATDTAMYISTLFFCLLFMGTLYYTERFVRPYTELPEESAE